MNNNHNRYVVSPHCNFIAASCILNYVAYFICNILFNYTYLNVYI